VLHAPEENIRFVYKVNRIEEKLVGVLLRAVRPKGESRPDRSHKFAYLGILNDRSAAAAAVVATAAAASSLIDDDHSSLQVGHFDKKLVEITHEHDVLVGGELDFKLRVRRGQVVYLS
jgi:hypothetical protein